MARSEYVYVVVPKSAMTPEAAFTVKYECLHYIEQRDPYKPSCLVYRFRSGDQSTFVYQNPLEDM